MDTADNSFLWGGQYNRTMAEIFTVQEEIAREISEKLRLRLSGEEKTRLAKHYTENGEAYELCLKGNYYQNSGDCNKAVESFQGATERDPTYAFAYAGLAESYSGLGELRLLPDLEAFSKAKAAAKALEIDRRLAEAMPPSG